jgi:hypothetical protein
MMDLWCGLRAATRSSSGARTEHRTFTSIYYIPKLKTNIISVGQLDEAGFDLHITSGLMCLRDANGHLLTKIS